MPGREDLIQQNRSRTVAQAVSQPQPPSPGVPNPSTPTTSGTGSSPGSPATGGVTGGNVDPSVKNNFTIKEKLLRPALTSHYQCWFNPPEPVLKWLNDKGLNYRTLQP